MSRIGKVPIPIPEGLQVEISAEMVVSVKGPKGSLTVDTRNRVIVTQEDGTLRLARPGDEKQQRADHGLYHRLITNAIHGVIQGYRRELELVGVGYKAEMQGADLVLNVGRSHQVRITSPEGVKVETPKPTQVLIDGIDKQKVTQAAARIRSVCPPEPYKGKGIRYLGETVKRKVGKTGLK